MLFTSARLAGFLQMFTFFLTLLYSEISSAATSIYFGAQQIIDANSTDARSVHAADLDGEDHPDAC
ncbi:MAG: hypothetical protein GY805_31240 [Chloroflexi bacterium]|nr:hypothetical protein [Chloroflexota bacterium]